MEDQLIICRTCLEVVEDKFSYIDEINTDSNKNIRNMLQLCMPELDLYVSTQPIICDSCLDIVSCFNSFKMKCLDTENKIHSYIRKNNLGGYSYVNLNCVLQDQLRMQAASNGFAEEQNGLDKNESDKIMDRSHFKVLMKGIVNREMGGSVEVPRCDLRNNMNNHFNGNAMCRNDEEINRIHPHILPEVVLEEGVCNLDGKPETPIVTKLWNNDNPILLSCPECSFVSTDQQKLEEHICSQDKEYKCHVCPYVTRRRHQLKKHVNSVHTKATWYFCDECSYKSTDSSSIRRHKKCMHQHGVDIMFQCSICPYRCATEFLYKKHLARHSGRTVLSCEYCSYETKDRSNFKKHTYIHITDKPKKCEICGYQCVSPYQMRRHIKKNHGGADYKTAFKLVEESNDEETVRWVGHETA